LRGEKLMKNDQARGSDDEGAEREESRRSVTIRDVARLAGVSPGTVSRAIRNSPLVNKETRKRIMEAVEELDYRPNLAARRLVLGRTLTIAVMAPFFTHPAVNRQLSGVVHALADSDYDLVIHHVASAADRERSFAAFPGRSQVDGVVLLSVAPTEEEADAMVNRRVAIVCVGTCNRSEIKFHQIWVDDVAGGTAVTEHLVGMGHERIGFLGDSTDNPLNLRASHDKRRGYLQAMENAGLDPQPLLIREGPHDWRVAERLATEMLSQPDRPTAIFAASDIHAVGVLRAAKRLDIGIPRELSVAGCGDVDLAEIMEITTLRQPLFELGTQSVNLLLEAIENPEMAPVIRILPTELVQRRTTGPVRS
jgi:DNA-binding LacI/PurR family transcriptional regulator